LTVVIDSTELAIIATSRIRGTEAIESPSAIANLAAIGRVSSTIREAATVYRATQALARVTHTVLTHTAIALTAADTDTGHAVVVDGTELTVVAGTAVRHKPRQTGTGPVTGVSLIT
jgi:hypothetical protein